MQTFKVMHRWMFVEMLKPSLTWNHYTQYFHQAEEKENEREEHPSGYFPLSLHVHATLKETGQHTRLIPDCILGEL